MDYLVANPKISPSAGAPLPTPLKLRKLRLRPFSQTPVQVVDKRIRRTLFPLKLLVDADALQLGGKTKLIFYIFCTTPAQKTFPRYWASGGARSGAQALGAHQHITLSHLKRVLRINLDQNMPKNVCFLEKSSIIAKASGASPPNPHLPSVAKSSAR